VLLSRLLAIKPGPEFWTSRRVASMSGQVRDLFDHRQPRQIRHRYPRHLVRLPEIIGICDRVIVMRAGRIAGEMRRSATSPLDQEEIMALATGMEQLDAS